MRQKCGLFYHYPKHFPPHFLPSQCLPGAYRGSLSFSGFCPCYLPLPHLSLAWVTANISHPFLYRLPKEADAPALTHLQSQLLTGPISAKEPQEEKSHTGRRKNVAAGRNCRQFWKHTSRVEARRGPKAEASTDLSNPQSKQLFQLLLHSHTNHHRNSPYASKTLYSLLCASLYLFHWNNSERTLRWEFLRKFQEKKLNPTDLSNVTQPGRNRTRDSRSTLLLITPTNSNESVWPWPGANFAKPCHEIHRESHVAMGISLPHCGWKSSRSCPVDIRHLFFICVSSCLSFSQRI